MPLPTIPVVGAEAPCVPRGCSACCHDTQMLLTNEDVLRLGADHADEPFWYEDDGYLALATRDAPAIEGHAGRPCWFLGDDGRCTVHDKRPAGCRLYPAIWDTDLGRAVMDSAHCPHTDGFRLPRITQDAVKRLVDTLEAERAARMTAKQG